MFAVVETGGKQYKVAAGQEVYVEKLEVEEGGQVQLDKVLLICDGEKTRVGAPYIQGAKVQAKVVGQGKSKKIIVFKYKAKKNYRKKQGHRQPFTRLEILSIEG